MYIKCAFCIKKLFASHKYQPCKSAFSYIHSMTSDNAGKRLLFAYTFAYEVNGIISPNNNHK